MRTPETAGEVLQRVFAQVIQRQPLEQRLANYLAKKFVAQPIHRVFLTQLATALAIQTAQEYDVWRLLKGAAEALLKQKLPFLEAFRLERSREGVWMAVFEAKRHSTKSMIS